MIILLLVDFGSRKRENDQRRDPPRGDNGVLGIGESGGTTGKETSEGCPQSTVRVYVTKRFIS